MKTHTNTITDLVKKKALERLEAMGLTKCAELTDVKSRFYQKPSEYAMYRFSYFTCFKCNVRKRERERECVCVCVCMCVCV